MSKIRINELARELEVKPNKLLDLLPQFGITEKKTHSSSLEDDIANKLRRYFGLLVEEPVEAEPEITPREMAPETGPSVEAIEQTTARTDTPTETQPTTVAPVESLAPTAVPPPDAGPLKESPFAPRTAPQRLRPPLAGSGHSAQPAAVAPDAIPTPPAPPTPVVASGPGRPAVVAAKPLPVAPRPGQILTGPRQPFPVKPEIVKSSVPSAEMPAEPQAPLPQAATVTHTPRSQAKATLAGQPAARPVVPPRPDLVARLAQTQIKAVPGQPQPRPGRPATAPVPGQPIYRGPIRPGQALMTRPSPGAPGRVARGRPLHPTSARLEPPPPVPTEQRRPGDRRARTPAEREREREREERTLRPSRRDVPVVLPSLNRQITVAEGITVKELSEKLGLKANLVIKKLVERKIFATINQTLDLQLAEELVKAFGATSTRLSYEEEAVQEVGQAEAEQDLLKRPPVVTVMGHVDHGKTSLLDAIRLTNVAEREAGGITQHIGAYHIEKNGRKIVFIDTPGHEAFTRMRARGAKVTDIVVLVVAADDGVMPQTLEAIDHARAAGVPIIVAINKIDRPDAQPERIKQQLADRGLLAEEWGGETVVVPVSAKTKQNLDLLLEMILLVADIQDLKANPARPAVGSVLEAQLDRGRGPVATVLVRNGTLSVGDYFICGSVFGKVRAMFDDRGEPVKSAEPSMPVEVIGLESLPEVGDTFQMVTDTAKAKQIVIYREAKAREQAMARSSRVTLDQLHEQIRAGEVKELPIILKTDVGGTAEVLTDTLQKLSTDKVRVRVLHASVGAITETDVLLASASNAVIIGFNVRPERNAAQLAENEKVDIRLHTIIYDLVDEMKRAMTGMLEPVFREVFRGRAEVKEVFRITKVGIVAGCQVIDGTVTRDSEVRVLRDNVVVHTGRVGSLRRFKNDVSEVKSGMECGVSLENFGDVKPGDVIEAFVTEQVAAEALA
ncbi:MAG TPA: translation initiation factor IF-2 [Bryobacteraceae bacterium]|nr:translation initiation factor IF-2 [Bryobacteraceae bacterium]